ncbi:MAG: endonuclease/exonuclease/phosphatase family protein [Firmicutes bacterium]|nr:endonuclease/exonuclease/phosphatase family protein [Bacillota bacterium]
MQKYRILSFNLRVNVASDGKHAWGFRKEQAINFIKQGKFDIIGFQEVTPDMYQELREALHGYDHFGIGRDINQEAIPIFFKKDKYRVIEKKTMWLSDTPTVESKIEGSFFPRIVTYVVLEDEKNQRISYFNTHLDYASDEVCKKQSIILSQIIDKITDLYQAEFILSGDFNVYPDTETIKFLANKYQNIYKQVDRIGLTFHNFSLDTLGLPIDYFFFSKKLKDESFQIVHHEENDFFLSDHYPLIAEFSIKK